MYIKTYSDCLQVVCLENTKKWNMYKSLKKVGKMQVVVFPLHCDEHLLLLCGQTVALPVACCRLPADVALNKPGRSGYWAGTICLRPSYPWLYRYSRYQLHGLECYNANTETHTVTSKTSEDFCDQKQCFLISEMWLMDIKLHVKFIINVEMKRRPLVPLWNWGPCPFFLANTDKERTLIFIVRPPC